MANVEAGEAPASPVTETRSHDSVARDDALSQATLQILERIARSNTGTVGCGSITKQLRFNGVEIFKGIARIAPIVAKYWIEARKRIMDDLDCTPEQKLKSAVSLLRDEAYKWWLTGKYMGASYVDARRREFLNLNRGNKSVVEYKAEFLRLSRYTCGMVAIEYERYVHFEDGLRNSLRVLIAPQRERDFAALVDKAKIAEDVKRTEQQHCEKEKGRNKRDSKPLSSFQMPKKKARVDGPVRVGAPIAAPGSQPCADCGRCHQVKCWKRIGACLRCRSLEHHIKDCPRRPDQMRATDVGIVQSLRSV
ncbi:uncharacterized protein LOC108481849 [Gossypium arboreum]|uniref:uncharacterized protein LOC108481849 n=1 Tax=Gossypium arboreum TaxID=29729 RepID=UPI000818FF3D|nr:uncharacterized protein LOC108481849 [Gossypium arboreum]